MVAGTPFLLSPTLEYDVSLNGFFQSVGMVASAWNTQAGYARDLAALLTFLWSAREGRGWREATEADHLAYLYWRRRDSTGPQVSGAAWDREVAAVNRFYRWRASRWARWKGVESRVGADSGEAAGGWRPTPGSVDPVAGLW